MPRQYNAEENIFITDDITRKINTQIFAVDLADATATVTVFTFFIRGLESEMASIFSNVVRYFTSIVGNLINLMRAILCCRLVINWWQARSTHEIKNFEELINSNIPRAALEVAVSVSMTVGGWLSTFGGIGVTAAPYITVIALGLKALYSLSICGLYSYKAFQAWSCGDTQNAKIFATRAVVQLTAAIIVAAIGTAVAALFIFAAPVTVPTLGGISFFAVLANTAALSGSALGTWAYLKSKKNIPSPPRSRASTDEITRPDRPDDTSSTDGTTRTSSIPSSMDTPPPPPYTPNGESPSGEDEEYEHEHDLLLSGSQRSERSADALFSKSETSAYAHLVRKNIFTDGRQSAINPHHSIRKNAPLNAASPYAAAAA